jgi:tetratricopeptide (TPR) repeat protein
MHLVLYIAGAANLVAMLPQGAFDLNERGLKAWNRGAYAESVSYYRRALDIWRALGPAYEAHTGGTLANLGQSLCGEGKWSDGAKALDEALTLDRRSLGSKHVRTVAAMNMLGNVSMLLGDTKRAEALFQEALGIQRELYPNQIDMVHSLSGLAGLRLRAGKPEESLPLAEEALEIALKVEGEDSPETALTYGSVAMAHRFAGRPARAIPLFRKGRSIYERTGWSESPRFASFLSEEGLALMDDGQLSLAEKDMVGAAGMLASCTGCNLQRAVVETNLGQLRLRQRKYGEADKVLAHALDLERQITPFPGNEMALTLQILSRVREKERRYADAAQLRRQAAAIESYR